MITLTTGPIINSVLGGNAPVIYDKLVTSQINYFPEESAIRGRVHLSSTSDPDMTDIIGRFEIAAGELEIGIEQIDFYRKVRLSGPAQTAVQALIDDSQNSLEDGLIALGVIDGVQTAGV